MSKSQASARSRAPNRKSIDGIRISPEIRLALYGQRRVLPQEFREASGLLIPFVTYFQDPFVASRLPKTFDEQVLVAWEPGLTDGPTSARFAVVDYNAQTGTLEPPAIWHDRTQTFVGSDGKPLGPHAARTFQFHQVSVWALLQRALDFFEDGNALGRTVPWAFEGNRLIVMPHAGQGRNAFYDRASKSLEFSYFGEPPQTVYTCLSSDIVIHEFGHAVLDGVRPLFHESSQPQTAAFHEFMGDFSAILLTLKNGTLRRLLAESSRGKFAKATTLSSLAQEFGRAVSGRPYLRSARNTSTLGQLRHETNPHALSEVLTGAMFDVLIALGERYERSGARREKPKSAREVFWDAADRMQRTAIQPLDLLPPVDVTFRDYAEAVCRWQQLSDPLDPAGYYRMLIEIFRRRQIFDRADVQRLTAPRYLHERFTLCVRPDIDDLSRSRASAARFLDDNRADLLIPARADFFVADLYDARKRGRQHLPLPRQIVLQYAWREKLVLEGDRFGAYAGRATTMLCGGTLVFDDHGHVVSWMRKPGSQPYAGTWQRQGRMTKNWDAAIAEGQARRDAFLRHLATQVAAGRVGNLVTSHDAPKAHAMPLITAEDAGEIVRFRLSPHPGGES